MWLLSGEFEFCDGDDDIEFENIFQSAFGGNRYFYWSFTIDDEPQFRNSSGYSSNHRSSGRWRHRFNEEYDSSSESEEPVADITPDRLALGLSASGPLNLEDVKNAWDIVKFSYLIFPVGDCFLSAVSSWLFSIQIPYKCIEMASRSPPGFWQGISMLFCCCLHLHMLLNTCILHLASIV